MNVLKLPLFLCEFSQAKLPVEVRQVRINTPAGSSGGIGASLGIRQQWFWSKWATPVATRIGWHGWWRGSLNEHVARGGSGGGSGGMGSGGLMGAMGGMPGIGGIGRAVGSGGDSGMASLNAESPYDATVEIYGIIYIYNPVDPAKLGIETKKALEDATPAWGGLDGRHSDR